MSHVRKTCLERFATRLSAQIASKNITQKELAARLDTSTSYLWKVLNAKVSPSLAQADCIARAVGTTLDRLIKKDP